MDGTVKYVYSHLEIAGTKTSFPLILRNSGQLIKRRSIQKEVSLLDSHPEQERDENVYFVVVFGYQELYLQSSRIDGSNGR